MRLNMTILTQHDIMAVWHRKSKQVGSVFGLVLPSTKRLSAIFVLHTFAIAQLKYKHGDTKINAVLFAESCFL